MKILDVEHIRLADKFTIENEPIKSIDLMERAASQLFKWIKKRITKKTTVNIFAGPGNNGGDGLALARLLIDKGFKVKVCIVLFTTKFSEDFKLNLNRLKALDDNVIFEIKDESDLPDHIEVNEIIVDAILGSGLSRQISGLAADVVHYINNQACIKIALDVPSGLFADKFTGGIQSPIIRADYTLSFQLPKFCFMMPENDVFCGKWQILNIGLSADFINSAPTANFYMTGKDVIPMLKPRPKFSHKGSYGHALLIAGGYGKIGAAVLSARAAIKSGLGLLHVHIPKSAWKILQTACPEAMLSIDRYENYFSQLPDLSPFNSIGIGPGLGMENQSVMAFKLLIQSASVPLVIDADALNMLSENKTWLAFLPKNSVLTPHPGEFKRLVGEWDNDFEKIEKQRSLAVKHKLTIVLKGANTSVCLPDGNIYFNSSGNAGMACGGSGDVLTGLITGLIARGYSSQQAAVIGVYLHGLAGDIAAKKEGYEAMSAGSMIESIPKAFKKLK